MPEQPATLAAALIQLQARLPRITKDATGQGGLVNPYEEACERFKILVELIVHEVDDEWEAARANLSRYEQSPGIPLPQYTPSGWPVWTESGS